MDLKLCHQRKEGREILQNFLKNPQEDVRHFPFLFPGERRVLREALNCGPSCIPMFEPWELLSWTWLWDHLQAPRGKLLRSPPAPHAVLLDFPPESSKQQAGWVHRPWSKSACATGSTTSPSREHGIRNGSWGKASYTTEPWVKWRKFWLQGQLTSHPPFPKVPRPEQDIGRGPAGSVDWTSDPYNQEKGMEVLKDTRRSQTTFRTLQNKRGEQEEPWPAKEAADLPSSTEAAWAWRHLWAAQSWKLRDPSEHCSAGLPIGAALSASQGLANQDP